MGLLFKPNEAIMSAQWLFKTNWAIISPQWLFKLQQGTTITPRDYKLLLGNNISPGALAKPPLSLGYHSWIQIYIQLHMAPLNLLINYIPVYVYELWGNNIWIMHLPYRWYFIFCVAIKCSITWAGYTVHSAQCTVHITLKGGLSSGLTDYRRFDVLQTERLRIIESWASLYA